MKGRSVGEIVAQLRVPPDEYALSIIRSVETHRDRALNLIERHSVGWPLARLAVVDRLIMTMAIGELVMDSPPPTPVVLNEAVELAHEYSTDDSSAFVNGVLSAVAADLGSATSESQE